MKLFKIAQPVPPPLIDMVRINATGDPTLIAYVTDINTKWANGNWRYDASFGARVENVLETNPSSSTLFTNVEKDAIRSHIHSSSYTREPGDIMVPSIGSHPSITTDVIDGINKLNNIKNIKSTNNIKNKNELNELIIFLNDLRYLKLLNNDNFKLWAAYLKNRFTEYRGGLF